MQYDLDKADSQKPDSVPSPELLIEIGKQTLLRDF